MKLFFDYPTRGFQLREISRVIKLGLPSVRNHVRNLEKDGLIVKERKGIYPSFKANWNNELFKVYKRLDIIYRINKNNLLKYIYDNCMPDAIILFGSASKGEDLETSDIDLFVQSPEKNLDLKKYEKMLNRKISLFFEEKFSRLSDELKNNILNGVILKGYIKVF